MRNRMRSCDTGHYFSRYLLTFIRQDSCPSPPVGATGTSIGSRLTASGRIGPSQPESAWSRRRQAASVDLSSAAQDEAAADDEGQGDDAGTQGGAGAGQRPVA